MDDDDIKKNVANNFRHEATTHTVHCVEWKFRNR